MEAPASAGARVGASEGAGVGPVAEAEAPASAGAGAGLAAEAEAEADAPRVGAGPATEAEPLVEIEEAQAAPEVAERQGEEAAQLRAGKYWGRRYELFTRYDEGIRMRDDEAWFSVTPEGIAARIAERCRCDVVLDLFAGVGGNAIQFARTCGRVLAVEIDLPRLQDAQHNARLYGAANIEFVHGDCTALAPALRADVVFLSPPWGALGYYQAFTLRELGGFDCHALVRTALCVSERVVFFLPRYTNFEQLAQLGQCHAREREARARLRAGGSTALAADGGEAAEEARVPVDIQVEDCADNSGTVRAKAVYLGFGGSWQPAADEVPPITARPSKKKKQSKAASLWVLRNKPCRNFAEGWCGYGGRCQFSHAPPRALDHRRHAALRGERAP
jgi:16S rRNA G966 N2-methylase RsmD